MICHLPTTEEKEATTIAQSFADPIVEMRRRFTEVSVEDKYEYDLTGAPVRRFIYVYWTIVTVDRGLRQQIPHEASDRDIAEAQENIARAAIFNEEVRKQKRRRG